MAERIETKNSDAATNEGDSTIIESAPGLRCLRHQTTSDRDRLLVIAEGARMMSSRGTEKKATRCFEHTSGTGDKRRKEKN